MGHTTSDTTTAPQWYTKEEMYDCLIHHQYSQEIAEELAEQYAYNLQKAFEKGYEKGQADKGRDKTNRGSLLLISIIIGATLIYFAMTGSSLISGVNAFIIVAAGTIGGYAYSEIGLKVKQAIEGVLGDCIAYVSSIAVSAIVAAYAIIIAGETCFICACVLYFLGNLLVWIARSPEITP